MCECPHEIDYKWLNGLFVLFFIILVAVAYFWASGDLKPIAGELVK